MVALHYSATELYCSVLKNGKLDWRNHGAVHRAEPEHEA